MNAQALAIPQRVLTGCFSPELLGQSGEFDVVARRCAEVANHFCEPISRLRCDPVRKFYELVWTWQEDVKGFSDVDIICTHPAYQQIIGMGQSALPLIFREMKDGDAYWFWALKAITAEDPVPEEDRGRIRKMKQHWLNWADEQGYA